MRELEIVRWCFRAGRTVTAGRVMELSGLPAGRARRLLRLLIISEEAEKVGLSSNPRYALKHTVAPRKVSMIRMWIKKLQKA